MKNYSPFYHSKRPTATTKMASYLFCWFAAQAEFYMHLCCCLAPMPYLADVSCKNQFLQYKHAKIAGGSRPIKCSAMLIFTLSSYHISSWE